MRLERCFGLTACLAATLCLLLTPAAFAAERSAEEVLRAKGFSRIGIQFLLDGDYGLAEWLRQVRASEKKVQDAVKRRTNLDREIVAMEKSADSLCGPFACNCGQDGRTPMNRSRRRGNSKP